MFLTECHLLKIVKLVFGFSQLVLKVSISRWEFVLPICLSFRSFPEPQRLGQPHGHDILSALIQEKQSRRECGFSSRLQIPMKISALILSLLLKLSKLLKLINNYSQFNICLFTHSRGLYGGSYEKQCSDSSL